MLTETYIEALLVDEELADQVWEAWDKGKIDDQVACLAWWLIALSSLAKPTLWRGRLSDSSSMRSVMS